MINVPSRFGISTLYEDNLEFLQVLNRSAKLQRVYNSEGYIVPVSSDIAWADAYYYYATDHLGNIREVYKVAPNETDGTICAQLLQQNQYYPSGLPWANSVNASVQSHKYGGKEFIEAHGLDEYDSEARWYYPAIMRTTTMDPLCEKYYSISPYAWCGNNPVNLVDPDGRKLNISGDLSREALSQLQSYVGKSVVLIRDDNGDVSYKETRHHISIRAKRICGIINEEAIQVNVITTSGSGTSDVDYFVGGAFLGNTVTENSSEGEVNVTATQLVNPYVLKKADTYSYSGKSIAHEITEAYQGAKISTKKKTSSPRAGIDGSVYPRAHRRATPQPPIYKIWLDKNGNETRNEEEVTHIIYYVESMSGERQTIQEVK